jgi:hypothetical protein
MLSMKQRQPLGALFDKTGLTNHQIAARLEVTIDDVLDMRKFPVFRDTPGVAAQAGSLAQIAQRFGIPFQKLNELLKERPVIDPAITQPAPLGWNSGDNSRRRR